MRGRVWVVGLTLLFGGCGSEPPRPSETTAPPEPEYVPPLSARFIEPLVFAPYTRAEFPDTFKRWGSAEVGRINALRVAAAEKLIATERCNSVSSSELSPERSTSEPTVFVDCANGARAYLTVTDVADLAVKETTVVQDDAVSLCMGAATSNFNEWVRPANLTLREHEAFRSSALGTWMVRLTYRARSDNYSSGDLTATCSVDPSGEAAIWDIIEG